MEEENGIELFDPGTIMFFIMGTFSDVAFLGLLGLAIPGVGLAILIFVLGAHYFLGIIILAFFWGKTKGWMPKVFLLLGWILPLPLLILGLIFAIISSNKLVAFVIEQVAIQAIAVATAGAGEALEAGAIAAEGAEVAATAAEGAKTAETVVEGVEAASEAGGAAVEAGAQGIEVGAQGAEAGTETAEGASKAGEGVDLEPEEEKNPMENVEKELNEPSTEEFHEGGGAEQGEELEEEGPKKKSRAADRVKKVFDIADRANQSQDKGEDEDIDDDQLPMAA